MFGSYDRGALFTTPASDFAFDQWTIHAFSEVQIGVTNVQLHFGHADQAGDSAVSFNSIRIDLSRPGLDAVAASHETLKVKLLGLNRSEGFPARDIWFLHTVPQGSYQMGRVVGTPSPPLPSPSVGVTGGLSTPGPPTLLD